MRDRERERGGEQKKSETNIIRQTDRSLEENGCVGSPREYCCVTQNIMSLNSAIKGIC